MITFRLSMNSVRISFYQIGEQSIIDIVQLLHPVHEESEVSNELYWLKMPVGYQTEGISALELRRM